MSIDGSGVMLPGRAQGFPFETLRGGYLLCFKDQHRQEQRIQVDTLFAARCVLEKEGNPEDVVTYSFEELFPNREPLQPVRYVDPNQFDLLLTDIKESDLFGSISTALNVNYLELQPQLNAPSKVYGTLFGIYMRPVINLVISTTRFKKAVNIIFIIDTGSPCLYICERAMTALGYTDLQPPEFKVVIGTTGFTAHRSHNHFADVNLIGAAVYKAFKAKLEIDYNTEEVMMEFN